MEHIRVKNISESDFETIIKKAGGSRVVADESMVSADFILNEAVIELKFIQEEGFEVSTRQAKIANLFRQYQPRIPVVTIKPEILDEADSRTYYNIIAGPIKTHVKKADKQLDKTAQRYEPKPVRVLVIVNLGYTALSPDEFKAICFKCVRNDTTKIDWLVCGGVYLHSDKFDSYLFSRFEPVPINLKCLFPSFDPLFKAWDKFVEDLATSLILEPNPEGQSRLPVLDIAFDIDGVRYVKAAPVVPSSMWPFGHGPRENTSQHANKCPPLSTTYATFSEENWQHFHKMFPHAPTLASTHQDHLKLCLQKETEHQDKLKPFVPVRVDFEEFKKWISKPECDWVFMDVAKFANELFISRIKATFNAAIDGKEMKVVPLEYVYLVVREVGQDKINDYCSIYYVSETPGFKHKELILENEKIFFEYGLALAATYAAKRNVGFLIYTKNNCG